MRRRRRVDPPLWSSAAMKPSLLAMRHHLVIDHFLTLIWLPSRAGFQGASARSAIAQLCEMALGTISDRVDRRPSPDRRFPRHRSARISLPAAWATASCSKRAGPTVGSMRNGNTKEIPTPAPNPAVLENDGFGSTARIVACPRIVCLSSKSCPNSDVADGEMRAQAVGVGYAMTPPGFFLISSA
jgi:hypothetical protein